MECKYLAPLTIFLLLYLCVGAAIFAATENAREQESVDEMLRIYQHFIGNHSCLSAEELAQFLGAVLEKVGPYGGLSRAKFDSNLTRVKTRELWDFPGAFTFSVTVITTIGYGHIYPVSPLGKIMCVIYAIVGIPITLLVLHGIGEQLNKIGLKIMKLKFCFKSDAVNKTINIVCVVFAGIMLMFLIPTIVFNQVEDWDILKCLYYCFITLSTIGFGDFVAGDADKLTNEDSRNVYRIVVYLWILVGLAYISLIIKSISDLFVKKAEQVQKEAKRVASTKLANLSTAGPISAIAVLGSSIDSGGILGRPPDSVEKKHTNMFKQPGLKRLRGQGDEVSYDKDTSIHLVKITNIHDPTVDRPITNVKNDEIGGTEREEDGGVEGIKGESMLGIKRTGYTGQYEHKDSQKEKEKNVEKKEE